VMTDRDGINAYRLGKLVDRDLGLAQKGLEDAIFRAFHAGEYNELG
jgi:hypothetical protein